MDLLGEREYFVEVALPLALPKILTYRYFGPQKPVPGLRVVVPLKGKKLFTGIVWSVKENLVAPGFEIKNLIELIDETPFLSQQKMRFLEWMAEYYLCTLGEVLTAAIPSPFRLSSESFMQIHPDYQHNKDEMMSEEIWVFNLLEKQIKVSLSDLLKALPKPAAWMRIFRKWQEEGRILIFDELPDQFKPKTEIRIGLMPAFQSDSGLDIAFEKLQARPDEEALLLKFLAKTGFGIENEKIWNLAKANLKLEESEKKALLKLIRKGILFQEKVRIKPFYENERAVQEIQALSEPQQQAFAEIEAGFEQKQPVLLLGVTGSGKTEVYIHLISKAIKEGKSCLMMLPEIAISVQIVHRLRLVFGEQLGVFHSKATLPERMEVWEGVETGKIKLVVGVRSAIFLPFSELGLLIVDEEHDASYKQNEPAPRYHGRDAAMFLAHLLGTDILLGSATPSVESYYKAKYGKWRLVNLRKRFGGSQLPDIEYIDMKLAEKTLQVKLDFSNQVLEKLQLTKEGGKQSIVFQNRRGYAPYLQCKDCGWIAYCPNCDVSLTYHQTKKKLSCHYCGHSDTIPKSCPACGSVQVQTIGYGTEKLEESLEQLLPDLKIARMDQDTTSSRKSYEQMLSRMRTQELDTLVGTQMVTKGLDFENVTFVSVFDIDRVLHYPDFRANERTFQLLTQISGRAGRRNQKGLVMVQTYKPYHPIYSMVAKGELDLFYETEILHRKDFEFPPFARLVKITTRHKEQVTAGNAALELSRLLLPKLGPQMVFGPEVPPIARLRNQYIFNVMLKIPISISASRAKEVLREEVNRLQASKEFSSTQWILDVDPV
jgi:primosomal protein N' (replication factor Y)